MISVILSVIGGITATYLVLEHLWSPLEQISSYLMPFFLPGEEQSLTKRFGTWAAVTGSTDGIGKQYAKELASRGMNVVLISRSKDKLTATAAEIEKEHSVKTKIIVADFSTGPTVYPHIEKELEGIPLGILVNNVGLNYDYPMRLCEVPSSKAWEMISVNIGAVTLMSKMVLPGMVARGKGALVNVSSGSELQPLPLMTVYAATKAYIKSFTMALREEYASKGIHIQHLSPFFVSTKINAFSKTIMDGNILVPDVKTYARSAVASLGKVHNTTGYWVHGLQYFVIRMLPVWLRVKIGLLMNKLLIREYQNNMAKSS